MGFGCGVPHVRSRKQLGPDNTSKGSIEVPNVPSSTTRESVSEEPKRRVNFVSIDPTDSQEDSKPDVSDARRRTWGGRSLLRQLTTGSFVRSKQQQSGSPQVAATSGSRRRFRGGTVPDIDKESRRKLRDFLERNREANEAEQEDLRRRDTIVTLLGAGARASHLAGIAALSAAAENASGDMEEVVQAIDETAEEEQGGSPGVTFAKDTKFGSQKSKMTDHKRGEEQRRRSRAQSKIPSTLGDTVEAVSAIREFARRKSLAGDAKIISSANDVVQPYDLFSPDVRSTRWGEYCEVLKQDDPDFKEVLHPSPSESWRNVRSPTAS